MRGGRARPRPKERAPLPSPRPSRWPCRKRRPDALPWPPRHTVAPRRSHPWRRARPDGPPRCTSVKSAELTPTWATETVELPLLSPSATLQLIILDYNECAAARTPLLGAVPPRGASACHSHLPLTPPSLHARYASHAFMGWVVLPLWSLVCDASGELLPAAELEARAAHGEWYELRQPKSVKDGVSGSVRLRLSVEPDQEALAADGLTLATWIGQAARRPVADHLLLADAAQRHDEDRCAPRATHVPPESDPCAQPPILHHVPRPPTPTPTPTPTLPLRGSTDFRGVHSRASEVIVATSMIDSDYRYTQDAPQKDRSAILHYQL